MKIKFTIGLLTMIVALIIFKPDNHGAPYSPYFTQLNSLLKSEGFGRPVLVLDLDRLDHNIDRLRQVIQPPRTYRVVAKSLPSIELLNYIFNRAGTKHAMVFHEPFLRELAQAVSDVEILIGKPFPAAAVDYFYAEFPTDAAFNPSSQLQWLVDDVNRLANYQNVASQRQVTMQVNIEIDVGLHRGGLKDVELLAPMLDIISNDQQLNFSGFMGYDAHVMSAPPVIGSIDKALQKVLHRYQLFFDAGLKAFPELFQRNLTLNGAGSKTYTLYTADDLLNDLSVGSALVKPTDFDAKTLTDHQSALFIATPVLKKLKGSTIPYIEWASPLFSWWDPNQAWTYFIYGGGWLAEYESPEGLQDNAVYGFSTNQAIINGSDATHLNVDDYIFLRPRQSEHVMLQFGDVLVVRQGKVVASWPVFKN